MYDYSENVEQIAQDRASSEGIASFRDRQMYLKEMERQRKDLRRQQRSQKNNWWKRMLGNTIGTGIGALGMGLGMGAGPVGMAIGAGLGSGLGGGIADALGGSPQAGAQGMQLGQMAYDRAQRDKVPATQGPNRPLTENELAEIMRKNNVGYDPSHYDQYYTDYMGR